VRSFNVKNLVNPFQVGLGSEKAGKGVKKMRDVKALEQIKNIKKDYEKDVVEASGREMSWEDFLKDVKTGLGLREVCS